MARLVRLGTEARRCPEQPQQSLCRMGELVRLVGEGVIAPQYKRSGHRFIPADFALIRVRLLQHQRLLKKARLYQALPALKAADSVAIDPSICVRACRNA